MKNVLLPRLCVLFVAIELRHEKIWVCFAYAKTKAKIRSSRAFVFATKIVQSLCFASL